MPNSWKPRNWDEVCKRNAGRRKLHMRRREERAERIEDLLADMSLSTALCESSYGWLPKIAQRLGVSRATVSRDLALCRRIHAQFFQMFGRPFAPRKDQIVWSWDWSHYGFRTTETKDAGYEKPVGRFPFATRETSFREDAFCGLGPSSWNAKAETTSRIDFFSVLRALSGI